MPTLLSPRGLPFEVSDEDAKYFLESGYRMPTDGNELAAAQHRATMVDEQGGTLGGAKAFGEGAADALTLGGSSWIEKALGVDPEAIRMRSELHPIAHGAGTAAGIIAPLLVSGGSSALAQGGRGALVGAAELSAPSMVAKLGGAITRGLAPEGAGALRSIGAKVAGGVAEGAAFGLGDVNHEAAVGDPSLTRSSALEHIALSGLLGGGVAGGLAAAGHGATALVRRALGDAGDETAIGKKVADWLSDFEGERNLKAAGGIQSDLAKLEKTTGAKGARAIGREMRDYGLVDALSTPEKVAERAAALKAEVGPEIGAILRRADESTAPDQMASVADILADVRKESLAPLQANPGMKAVASKFGELLDDYEAKFGAEFKAASEKAAAAGEQVDAAAQGKITLEGLHDLRKQIDELVPWGKEPADKAFGRALRGFRGAVSDEIEATIDRIGADSAAWKAANRKFQVASVAADFARKGMQRSTGNNLIPLTSVLGGIGGGAALGSLPGGLATGAVSLLGRKYGSGVLGAGARVLREGIEDGGVTAAGEKLANVGWARHELTQLAQQSGNLGGAGHGIGAANLEASLPRPPDQVGEGVARFAMEDLLGGTGTSLVQVLGASVSPRLVEALGEMRAKAYGQALGGADDAEARRLLKEAGKFGYGGPFTSATQLLEKAQRGLLRETDPVKRADTQAIIRMARAAQRADVDAGLAPLTAEVVNAAWSHGPVAGMGQSALEEIRHRYGHEVAAAIGPSLRKASKAPQTGLVPPSRFSQVQAETRNGLNEALRQLGGAPHVAAFPETAAMMAVLARDSDALATRVQDAATAVATGKIPEGLRLKPMTAAETDKAMQAIRDLAADPQTLADAIDRHTDGLGDHVPQTGMAAAVTVSRGAQYLAAQLPEVRPPSLQNPEPGKPSKSAAASWGRKAQALADPAGALAAGPSPDAVAAVSAVYPQIWEQWRTTVVMALASAAAAGKPPSFQVVQRVSMAIGHPLVPGQEPAMAALTPMPQPAPAPSPDLSPKASKGGVAAADFGKSLRTGTQTTEARG